MVDRAAWVAEVLSYRDTPYLHQGRLPGVGMDCVAPLICAARKFNLVAPDFDVTGYPREPDGSLQPLLDKYLMRVDRVDLRLGDIVLNGFKTMPPQHVAIIVGERYGQWELLHAHSLVGKVQIERIQYGRHWRYVQGYSMPGVA